MPAQGTTDQPVKKQSKWSPEEDALIIELRGSGMKWEDVSKRLPGRSAISCRLHYQNYLERRSEWDEERKNKLARLYERFKSEMWAKVAEELAVPWRAAEAMHWQLGEADMARRAGVVPFSLASINIDTEEGAPTPQTNVHFRPQETMGRHITPPSPRNMYSSRHQSVPGAMPGQLPPRVENAGLQSTALPPHHPSLSTQSGTGMMMHGPLMDHGGGFYSTAPGGPGLAPIHFQGQPRNPGALPSLAELTTGVSPYSGPLDRPSSGHTSINTAVKHGMPMQIPQGYQQHMDQSGMKRRASSEMMDRGGSLRRRLG